MTDDTYLVELCGGRADGQIVEVSTLTCDVQIPGIHAVAAGERSGMAGRTHRVAMYLYRRTSGVRAEFAGIE